MVSEEFWNDNVQCCFSKCGSVRLRQDEESSEQVRQLLEADRTAGQMLEEQMSRTEASVRDTSLACMMDDPDLERMRRDRNQRTSVAKTLDGVIGPGCFVPWQDGSTEMSIRNHQSSGGTTWR